MYVLNRELESSVIAVNNSWENIKKGIGLEKSLNIIATYPQLENVLGLHMS